MRFLKFDTKTAGHIYHDAHRPGIMKAYKRAAARAVRHITRSIVEEQVDDAPVEESQVQSPVEYEELGADESRLILLDTVVDLMARYRKSASEVLYVNHSVGSMSWADFEKIGAQVRYTTGSYSVEGLTASFAVVAANWWIDVEYQEFGTYFRLHQIPAPKSILDMLPHPSMFSEWN